jgi:FkbM family methyltransferase
MKKNKSLDVRLAIFLKRCLNFYLRKRNYDEEQVVSSDTVLVKADKERSLFDTKQGGLMWLKTENYIDKCIIETGFFEKDLTEVAKKLVKPGDCILDVGANIGYYSLIFSRLTGTTGKVICFEPTDFYGKVLRSNIEVNKYTNLEIVKVGLSNKEEEINIHIGGSTASIHNPGNFLNESVENIHVTTLDNFIESHPLNKIDLIKLDVDGHEPIFFEGAWKTIEKFNPIIMMEVSHMHYLEAGYPVWEFYESLVSKGYKIYHEKNLKEITSKEEFLMKCGNFAYSSNIIISKNQLN